MFTMQTSTYNAAGPSRRSGEASGLYATPVRRRARYAAGRDRRTALRRSGVLADLGGVDRGGDGDREHDPAEPVHGRAEQLAEHHGNHAARDQVDNAEHDEQHAEDLECAAFHGRGLVGGGHDGSFPESSLPLGMDPSMSTLSMDCIGGRVHRKQPECSPFAAETAHSGRTVISPPI